MKTSIFSALLLCLSLTAHGQTPPEKEPNADSMQTTQPAVQTQPSATPAAQKKSAQPVRPTAQKPAAKKVQPKPMMSLGSWGVDAGITSDMFSYKRDNGDTLNLKGMGYLLSGRLSLVVVNDILFRIEAFYKRFNSQVDNDVCSDGKCEYQMDYLGAKLGAEIPILTGDFSLSGLVLGGYAGKLKGTNNVTSSRGDSGVVTLGLQSPIKLDAKNQIPIGLSTDIYSFSSTARLYSINLTAGYTFLF